MLSIPLPFARRVLGYSSRFPQPSGVLVMPVLYSIENLIRAWMTGTYGTAEACRIWRAYGLPLSPESVFGAYALALTECGSRLVTLPRRF